MKNNLINVYFVLSSDFMTPLLKLIKVNKRTFVAFKSTC